MASRQLRIVIEALDGFVAQIVRALVLDVVANLVRAPSDGGTPVDTGWARANWVPQIGTPRTTPAGSRAQAEVGSLPSDQDAGIAQMLGYRTTQGPVYITNNVPYILALNEGSSKQAPRGFVQSAVTKAVRVDLPAKFTGRGR